MPVFSSEKDADAHDRFVAWIEANPSGFVINRKGSTDMVIHTSSCGHFKPYDWANQTTNVKACSLDRTKLQHWAEVEGIDEPQMCNDFL